MQELHVLITELGEIKALNLTDRLAELLPYVDFNMKLVDGKDMRIRNLAFRYEVQEISKQNFVKLQGLVKDYHTMEVVKNHYAELYSQTLIDYLTQDLEVAYKDPDFPETEYTNFLFSLPKKVILAVRAYFTQTFAITNCQLSTDKYANARFADGSKDFRVWLTIADVLMPLARGEYSKMDITFDVFGKFDGKNYHFSFANAKLDKEKYFRNDAMMYEHRKEYLAFILENCQELSTGETYDSVLLREASKF